MPIREYKLDTGFTDQPLAIAQPRKPEGGNPLITPQGVFDTLTMLTAPLNPWGASAAYSRNSEVINAGFRMENDVLAAVDLMTRPTYEPDPTFDVVEKLKVNGLWDDYRDNFLFVQSEQEFNDVAQRIARENADRATLERSGLGGLLAGMAAGMLSPTVLLPFVGTGTKTVKAIGQGLAWGFAGGAAQEIPLQMAQETRTFEESAMSVGFSTILGGALGGAVGYLGRRTLDELAEPFERGIDETPGDASIPAYGAVGTAPSAHSLGAASARKSAGGLAPALGQEKEFIARMSPVTRVLGADSKQAQWMMAQLSDAGVRLEGNKAGIATSVGGTVEARVKTYYAPVADAAQFLDDAYARYWFGTQKPGIAAVQRAQLASLNPFRTQMTKAAFKAEVGRAMRENDQHAIPEVAEAAKFYREKIYDPVFERAQKAGIYKDVEELADDVEDETVGLLGDKSYLNRDYDKDRIKANKTQFVRILADHYEAKLNDQFQARLQKFLDKQVKQETELEDLQRPADEIASLREEFLNELKMMDATKTPEAKSLDERISELRSISRNKRFSDAERADAQSMLRDLEESAPATRGEQRAREREIKRRLKNLNRSMQMMEERQRAKLERVERSEELSLASLNRTVRAAHKLLTKLDNLSDSAFAKEVTKLKNMFADTAERFDAGEARIEKIFEDEFDAGMPTSPFVAAARGQTSRFDQLTELAERLENAEADRDLARSTIEEGLQASLVKVNDLNGRRAVRAARLEEQAADLDPKHVEARIAKLAEDNKVRKDDFLETWRGRGADDIDLNAGSAKFRRHAEEAAKTSMHKILGTHMRLGGMDLLLEPRGAELARVLDIDSKLIDDFLENDVEKLAMQYVRTLGPDIELRNKLGEFAPDMGRNMEFIKLQEEFDARDAAMKAEMTAKGASKEEMEKAGLKLSEEYAAIRRDLEAVIGRLRHTWGIPQDPSGFAARAARVVMNLNVLRFMGSVTISSLPDVARPIMKYGMMRTFRDGWVPFIKQLSRLQLNNRELRLAGAALDVVLHSRAQQIYDIGDYMVRGSKLEKALEWGTSKVGLIGVFDIWTTAMKQVAGSTAIAKLMDSIDLVVNLKGGMRETAQAIEFLAAAGIDNNLAARIWEQVLTSGGGSKVDGTWWPNTEAWGNANGEVDAFRAALVKEVDDTIITPGVERPLIADKSLAWRMAMQFKSFGMSSTTKTVLAGLQQRDMALINGTMVSLAMGALSYYIWAHTVGGTALAEMQAALDDFDGEGWERFADEAISRSGNLAIFQELQDFMSAIPITSPYANFSGDQSTRRGHKSDWLEVAGGPTADFVRTMGEVASGAGGVDDNGQPFGPTASTLHKLRTMIPLQNNFMLRRGFDAIEQAAGLPESR